MKPDSKAVEFIYQDTQINFLLSQGDNVMVNATEMAKLFDKQVESFMRNESTQNFIFECLKNENSRFLAIENEEDLFVSKQKTGTYFHRILAIKFAAWLDPNFEIWIYTTIDKILFGHYKQHWDAHLKQEDAKERMEKAKNNLLLNANQEDVIAYFEAEKQYKSAKNEKINAIQSQYRLFENL